MANVGERNDYDATIRAREVETALHFHNREYWYGRNGTSTEMDNDSILPFTLTAGNTSAYGTAVQLSDGTRIASGTATYCFDIHRLLITTASQEDDTYKIQLLTGTGLVGAAAVLTEVCFRIGTVIADAWPIEIMSYRVPCNYKLWAKLACTHDAATLSFIPALHLYNAVPGTFTAIGP